MYCPASCRPPLRGPLLLVNVLEYWSQSPVLSIENESCSHLLSFFLVNN
jgi:hypothetical protein